MSGLAAIPFQFMTSYDNTASGGIAVVDELHDFDLEKCGKSSRRHRAIRSQRIRGKWMRIDRNLPKKMRTWCSKREGLAHVSWKPCTNWLSWNWSKFIFSANIYRFEMISMIFNNLELS